MIILGVGNGFTNVSWLLPHEEGCYEKNVYQVYIFSVFSRSAIDYNRTVTLGWQKGTHRTFRRCDRKLVSKPARSFVKEKNGGAGIPYVERLFFGIYLGDGLVCVLFFVITSMLCVYLPADGEK